MLTQFTLSATLFCKDGVYIPLMEVGIPTKVVLALVTIANADLGCDLDLNIIWTYNQT